MGDGELHINEDDWSHSSGATCSPSVPLSFSSSNDPDEWSTRLYELDQLGSINRAAAVAAGKPPPEGSTQKPATAGISSEGHVINPAQLDDNANSVLYELDESALNLAYDNGERALRQNGCLSGASSPDLDDFGDVPEKSAGAELHLREVEEQLQNIFTPTPVELFRVVLRKYSSLDDFGFGVSDGIYEKGVFLSAIRPGGPADQSGVLNQYDRLLQVGWGFTFSLKLWFYFLKSEKKDLKFGMSWYHNRFNTCTKFLSKSEGDKNISGCFYMNFFIYPKRQRVCTGGYWHQFWKKILYNSNF